ncbi:adenosylhomocysteinase [Candidatus Roizmanbacteria bacterium]|nr:MAG: adenosylhomocysteinase [Candidatus Roizmanbacteria bacterium]
MKYDVTDIGLAKEGKKRIEWAEKDMPVLRLIREQFKKEKPLKGVKLAACLHVTSETANLMITLKEGGADVYLTASNPLSTNDAVAASLVKDFDVPTFAKKGEDNKTYYSHLYSVLDIYPNQTMDDGADLVGLLHTKYKKQIPEVIGSTEETTTGVIRLKAMEQKGDLKIPVVAVNDNLTKHLFDNRYGTGQSTIDALMRSTNKLIAGSIFVVCGYGWCGRGVAMRARGMGAQVVICEVDPVKALEAVMDGYLVMPLEKAIMNADFVVSVTGGKHIVDEKHLKKAKDGVILAQAGHFDIEINKVALKKLAKKMTRVRPMVDEYDFGNRRVYLVGEGRLVNLAAADGHPASVMDMSFAGQSLAAKYIWDHAKTLEPKVYALPSLIDEEIAALKLASKGISIDKLSKEQKHYLNSWEEGT